MFLEHLDTVIAFSVMMLLLSLIITTLVQMFAGFLSLRGKNLLWGTEQLLKQLDPRLEEEARKLANEVLTHPALAHRANKLATAMRSNELVLVLGQIVRGELKKVEDAKKAADAEAVEVANAVPAQPAAPVEAEAEGPVAPVAAGAANQPPLPPAAPPKEAPALGFSARILTALRKKLKKAAGAEAVKAANAAPAQPAAAVPAKAGGAEATRFGDTTLEALRELFQDKVDPNSPALEAKAQELIGRLTATFGAERVEDLRSAVVQTFGKTNEIVVQVDAWFGTVMDRTSERFKTWSRYITVGFALIFGLLLQIDSLSLYRRLSTDEALRGRLVSMADSVSEDAKELLGSKDAASKTIADLSKDAAAAIKEKLEKAPSDLGTLEDGETWLTKELAGVEGSDAFLKLYRERYPQAVKTRLGELQTTLSKIEGKVEATTPGLLPSRSSLTLTKYRDPLAWVGMLMTVAFLSLGAPFWFNALRSLSALKPVVSQKVVEEDKKTV
jgi:hypothetical protein